ncbi:MAG TPA: nucleotide pyrophosphohydrolase [Gemmata sp.]|nr:nucleotide pyrophosphohydrolase [Gemmata sp.]
MRGGNERGLSESTQIAWTNAMSDATTPVAALKDEIRRFAAERDWDPYHTPKNLTMALASEVGELCEVFRWLTPVESVAAPDDPKLREAIADEIADVANIVLLLSEHTGIDLSEAIRAKMAKNRVKYPAPVKPAGAE